MIDVQHTAFMGYDGVSKQSASEEIVEWPSVDKNMQCKSGRGRNGHWSIAYWFSWFILGKQARAEDGKTPEAIS